MLTKGCILLKLQKYLYSQKKKLERLVNCKIQYIALHNLPNINIIDIHYAQMREQSVNK